MIFSPNRPSGRTSRNSERQHVGEPALDAAADDRAEVDLGELLARADDQAADDRARDRVEAAEDQHRQRLQRDERQRELHAVARAPQHAGHQRDEAGDAQTITQICCSGMPTASAAW